MSLIENFGDLANVKTEYNILFDNMFKKLSSHENEAEKNRIDLIQNLRGEISRESDKLSLKLNSRVNGMEKEFNRFNIELNSCAEILQKTTNLLDKSDILNAPRLIQENTVNICKDEIFKLQSEIENLINKYNGEFSKIDQSLTNTNNNCNLEIVQLQKTFNIENTEFRSQLHEINLALCDKIDRNGDATLQEVDSR